MRSPGPNLSPLIWSVKPAVRAKTLCGMSPASILSGGRSGVGVGTVGTGVGGGDFDVGRGRGGRPLLRGRGARAAGPGVRVDVDGGRGGRLRRAGEHVVDEDEGEDRQRDGRDQLVALRRRLSFEECHDCYCASAAEEAAARRKYVARSRRRLTSAPRVGACGGGCAPGRAPLVTGGAICAAAFASVTPSSSTVLMTTNCLRSPSMSRMKRRRFG